MGNVYGQHYHIPKPRFELCNHCKGKTCERTDFMTVYGFPDYKRMYQMLVHCTECNRYWVEERALMKGGNSHERKRVSDLNEVPGEWVNSIGF